MLCVLFFCVPLWEKEYWRRVGGGFSLTELTEHLSQSKQLDHYEAGYLLKGKFASDDAIYWESTSTSEPWEDEDDKVEEG